MAMASSSSTPAQQSGASLQQQAIANAQSAFARLPRDAEAFRACVNQAQTITDVVQSIERRYHFYKRKRITRLLDKFHKHTLWLENISSAVDVVVQVNAGIACPLWAPIKFVLQVSKDHARAADEILNLINIMSDDLPRFELYQKLHADPLLQTSLLQIFTDVVEFSVKAFQYFSRSTSVRLFRLLICPFKDAFGDILDRVKRHAKNADSNAVATELLKNAEFRDDMEIQSRQTLIVQCQQWLMPMNVRDFHQQNIRLDGTGTWIWMHTAFVKWSEQSPSPAPASDRLLCIYGPHGCGKTALASSIAEGLERKKTPVLFYSFSGMESTRQTLSGLTRTLLWQLQELSCGSGTLEIIQDLMLNGPPSIPRLWDAIGRALGCNLTPIYCIIDGVDECNDSINTLLDPLLHLLSAHTHLRVALLGRPHGLRPALAATTLAIEINPDLIKQDIAKYIEAKIDQSTVLGLASLRDTISRALQEKADGMFLWAKLMVDELSRSATHFDVMKRLHSLPRGLEKAYGLLLSRLIERLGNDSLNLQLARRILAFTSVACRTLEIEEIRYACALDSRSSSTNSSSLDEHLLPQPETMILEVCRDFVKVRNGRVELVHFSVKEFLMRPDTEWSSDERGILCFRIDEPATHGNFGILCADYLEIVTDYDFPLHNPEAFSELRAHNPFLDYASMFIISHLSRSGPLSSASIDKLHGFLQSKKSASWIEYAAMLAVESGSLDVVFEDMDRLQNNLKKLEGSQSGLLAHALEKCFTQEMTRRVGQFGESDPRTEQWQALLDFGFACGILRHHENSSPPSEVRARREVTRSLPQKMIESFKSVSTTMPLYRQVDMLLRLQSYLLTAEDLTEPLKLLFRIILEKAASFPLYALLAIGGFYKRLHKWEEALDVYNIALRKANQPKTKLLILLSVGDILWEQQKYEGAETIFRQALSESEIAVGKEHEYTLRSAHDLALTLHKQAKYPESEELNRRVLQTREKLLGREHEDTLQSAHNLASTLHNQAKYPESEELKRRVLQSREKLLGREHEDTLRSAHNLASTLHNQAKYPESEELHRRVLQTREELLGREHKDTLRSADNLAVTLCFQANYPESEELHRRVLQTREKLLGREHEDTLRSAHQLAVTLYNQAKYTESEELGRRVLQAKEKLLGREHEDTLMIAEDLALTLRNQGKYAEAEDLGRKYTSTDRGSSITSQGSDEI